MTTVPPIYNNFWRRVFAAGVDTLIILPISLLPLLFFVGFSALTNIDSESFGEKTQWGYLLIFFGGLLLALIANALYEIILTKKYQGTWGKLLFRVRVVDQDGNALSWRASTARYFAKLGHTLILGILGLIPLIGGILSLSGYWICLFTKKRQTLHDMVAGTVVVRR
jgi:uncharacterized RDD family membrane protein YckC